MREIKVLNLRIENNKAHNCVQVVRVEDCKMCRTIFEARLFFEGKCILLASFGTEMAAVKVARGWCDNYVYDNSRNSVKKL